jgi:HAE1 family hydrophobic/amphiphilic exporter-1
VDRTKAADLGVRISDVTGALRMMVSGQDAVSTYREGDNQYDVKMMLLEDQRTDPTVLSRLVIPAAAGQVRLDSFATLGRGTGPGQIVRLNRNYQGNIYLNLRDDITVDRALPAIAAAVKKVGFPSGYSIRYTGQVQNLERTTDSLILAVLLAAIFMYMVLAAQFESFLHPFVIMLALPLSIPFALFTLLVTGRTLNLWSALGIMLLLGIVKKNGILQVDYTNRLREQGKNLHDAIMEANQTRLRPILMTTAAIVAGLIPTAVGYGEGAEQRAAIAVTIIGGQTLCLLLTLLIVPVAYSLFTEYGEAAMSSKLPYLSRFFPGRVPAMDSGKGDSD